MKDWIADNDWFLPALAALMAGNLVWRAYRFGTATGAYRALNENTGLLRSEALGG